MTSGNPLKQILKFSIPVILGSLLQNAYNIADTAIVGRTIGVGALAAVGATGTIFGFFVMLIYGLMSGFSIIAGTKYGARDYDGLRKVYFNGIILTLSVSVIITVFGTLFVKRLLLLMNTPADIIDDSCKYLFVVFCGITTTMLYNFFAEMMRALGNSKRPFIYLMIACGINIILDFTLIAGFGMGVEGAALATVISQATSAVLCGIYCHSSIVYYRINFKEFKVDFAVIKECLRIGIPNALLNAIITLGVIILQVVTNTIGTTYIAAYSAASKIISIATVPFFAITTAMNVFVSQNYGAGNIQRAKAGITQTIKFMMILNTLIVIIALTFSTFIIRFMIGNDADIIELAKKYIIVNAVAVYALVPLIALKGGMQAFGKPFFPTISGFLEVATRLFVSVYFTEKFGFTGIILTDPVTWFVTCIFFVVVYKFEINKIKSSDTI